MTDGWMVATAIGTIGSALAVAFQSVYTRGAVKASRKALKPAETVAIYAARSGIDKDAPKIEITLGPHPRDWLLEPSTTAHLGGAANPFEPGRTWHLPRDAAMQVLVRFQVLTSNQGNVVADLSFNGAIRDNDEDAISPAPPRLLRPNLGRDFTHWLEMHFTVQQWAENWQAREDGQPYPHGVEAVVTCLDGRDEGVEDTWRLRLTGCPIRPVPQLDGKWEPNLKQDGTPAPGCLDYERRPARERKYWVSHSRGIELPSPYVEDVGFWRHAWKIAVSIWRFAVKCWNKLAKRARG